MQRKMHEIGKMTKQSKSIKSQL